MMQDFIVPSLTGLSLGSVALAGLYFRGYSALKKQIQELAEETGAEETSARLAEMSKQIEKAQARVDDQIERVQIRVDDQIARAQTRVDDQLERIQARVDDLEKRRNVKFETAAAGVSASAPSNANRRGQVMRLHRSGESVSSIASALGISQGEVRLLVKVQELLAENGGE